MDPRVAQSALAPRPFKGGKALGWSALAHVALLGVVLVFPSFCGAPRIDLEQKPIQARLVRKGTPRDEKLLPRKEELPPPPEKIDTPPPPVPVPEAAPPPAKPSPSAVAIPDTKKPAPQKGETSEERRKRLFGAFDQASKKAPEELEGAADGDELGDSAVAEGERYYASLKAQAKRYYDVSQTISDQERLRLSAVVKFSISATGELTSVGVAQSSGNALFDAAVVSAMKKAAPFPPPPEHLRSELRKGILVRFTP